MDRLRSGACLNHIPHDQTSRKRASAASSDRRERDLGRNARPLLVEVCGLERPSGKRNWALHPPVGVYRTIGTLTLVRFPQSLSIAYGSPVSRIVS